MKMFRKSATILMSLVMVLTLFTACSSKKANENQDATNSPEATPEATDKVSDGFNKGKFDPPITITTVFSTNTTDLFKNGETKDNNFVTKWAHDSLGINIKAMSVVPDDQAETKLRLMLSTEEAMPDVVTASGTMLNDLLESGRYKDIGPEFDKYASEAMKAVYKDPTLWDLVSRDGKRMGIPLFERAGQNNGLMWIRQDWLDKLGLQPPKTMEELESVLQAFKDNADKLGEKNLIPLGLSLNSKEGTNGWFGESTWLFGPYGTIPQEWLKGSDGSLVYGSIQPGMKQGLALLAGWYQKGLVSKEVGLHDETKVAELIGQGKVGVVVSPAWSAGWPIPDLKKNVSGANMKAYPLPTVGGKGGSMDTNFKKVGLLVNKDFKNTDALFLYLNKIFEYFNPPVGSEFEKGFKEGYDYILKSDGTVSRDQNDFPDKKVVYPEHFFIAQMQDPYLGLQISSKLVKGEEAVTPAEKLGAAAFKQNPDQTNAEATIFNTLDRYVPTQYNGAPVKTQVEKSALLHKIEFEELLKIVYGKASVDDFDNFVKEYNAAGGEQITKEVNEAYSKAKGK